MRTRQRPPKCCEVPNPPVALAEDERGVLLGFFRALSDPKRLDIFLLIAGQEAPICACDIVGRFELAQPTISHHLKVLADAGLISVSRHGVWAFYAVTDGGAELLDGLLGPIASRELAPVG